MELKDFVTESLVQIMEGVADAQKRLKGAGGRVSPRMRATDKEHTIGQAEMDGGQPVSYFEFDVLVSASKGKGSRGSVALVVGVLGLGTQAQSEAKSGQDSRIKFKAPYSPLARTRLEVMRSNMAVNADDLSAGFRQPTVRRLLLR